MMGLAIQVAMGNRDTFTLDEIRAMTQDPDHRVAGKDMHKLMRAPPEGLTFLGSEYGPEDLEGETDDVLKLPVGPQTVPGQWRPTVGHF